MDRGVWVAGSRPEAGEFVSWYDAPAFQHVMSRCEFTADLSLTNSLHSGSAAEDPEVCRQKPKDMEDRLAATVPVGRLDKSDECDARDRRSRWALELKKKRSSLSATWHSQNCWRSGRKKRLW